MSLHAQLSHEAQLRLDAMRRKTTISAIIIALLVVVLLGLIMAFLMVKLNLKEAPVIVTYHANHVTEDVPESKKMNTSRHQKPSSPSASNTKVIVATTATSLAIPVPDAEFEAPSVAFGSGEDFGNGWSSGGDEGGGGSMFGSTRAAKDALKGYLYDFKQNNKGKELRYNPATESFADIVNRAEKKLFSARAFEDYFKAPNELYLNHLAIAFSPASLGPEYFGAKDTIKPSGWVAVYRGLITAPESGKFRFRGASDDYMVIMVGGKKVLAASWPDLQSWTSQNFSPGKMKGSDASPLGSAKLYAGEWMSLSAGRSQEIVIAIGERPGGKVGFLLEIEQQGVDYRSNAEGRTILPLFTTRGFSDEQKHEIQAKFGNYEFEWNHVPVFGIK